MGTYRNGYNEPHFTKFKYDEQNLAFSNIPFRMHVIKINNQYYYLSSNLKVIEVSEDGKLIQSLSLKEENGMKKTMTFTDKTHFIINKINNTTHSITNIQNMRNN